MLCSKIMLGACLMISVATTGCGGELPGGELEEGESEDALLPAPPTVQIYQKFNYRLADNFYTSNPNEGGSEWMLAGPAWKLSAVHIPAIPGIGGPAFTQALYRCRIQNTMNHFVTGFRDCEGPHVNEGVLGYIYTTPTVHPYLPNLSKLWRCVKGMTYIAVTDTNICVAHGFRIEYAMGWVAP